MISALQETLIGSDTDFRRGIIHGGVGVGYSALTSTKADEDGGVDGQQAWGRATNQTWEMEDGHGRMTGDLVDLVSLERI